MRRRLATVRHRLISVPARLVAVGRIGSIPFTLPTIALPLAARGWKLAVRGAWARTLSSVVVSALCALTGWSADGVAKGHRVSAPYRAPRCDDPVVIDQIIAEFPGRYRASGVAPVLVRAREAGWQSWPQDRWPRRFCKGTIMAPSDAERPIFYAIVSNDQSYELEWCVVGLDVAWPYDPRCRLARP